LALSKNGNFWDARAPLGQKNGGGCHSMTNKPKFRQGFSFFFLYYLIFKFYDNFILKKEKRNK